MTEAGKEERAISLAAKAVEFIAAGEDEVFIDTSLELATVAD